MSLYEIIIINNLSLNSFNNLKKQGHETQNIIANRFF